MSDYEKVWEELEKAVQILMLKNSHLKSENQDLKAEVERLNEDLATLATQNKEITNINKQLKIASAMDGNPEHRKLMKLKLNQLIKEVDLCISEVKKTSI